MDKFRKEAKIIVEYNGREMNVKCEGDDALCLMIYSGFISKMAFNLSLAKWYKGEKK